MFDADPPKVNVSTSSERDGVSVTLEWTPEGLSYSYDVIAIPSVEVTYSGRTRVQLMLSYNTPYTASLVATHPCGKTRNISFFEFFYREFLYIILCVYALILLTTYTSYGIEMLQLKH